MRVRKLDGPSSCVVNLLVGRFHHNDLEGLCLLSVPTRVGSPWDVSLSFYEVLGVALALLRPCQGQKERDALALSLGQRRDQ